MLVLLLALSLPAFPSLLTSLFWVLPICIHHAVTIKVSTVLHLGLLPLPLQHTVYSVTLKGLSFVILLRRIQLIFIPFPKAFPSVLLQKCPPLETKPLSTFKTSFAF